MKKCFFIFIFLCCLNIVYTSCDKKDDNNLIGTNWVGYFDWGTKYTFTFIDNDTCIETYYSENPSQLEHKYKLTGNKIDLFVTDNEDKLYATGNISGNNMILLIEISSGQQVSRELVRE